MDEQFGLVLAKQEMDVEQEMIDGDVVDGVDVLEVSAISL